MNELEQILDQLFYDADEQRIRGKGSAIQALLQWRDREVAKEFRSAKATGADTYIDMKLAQFKQEEQGE